ncbi:MAG: hypothetical protein ACSHWV_10630 [Cellulophaga fucicola]
MKTKIQNNITENDSAYQISLTIKFNSNVSESIIDEIDTKLNESLLRLGIGFGSAHGIDFLKASLLDFGHNPSFKDAKETINISIEGYLNYIEIIEFNKSEFLISEIDFIGKEIGDFEKTTKELKRLYSDLEFNNIENHNDSPEIKSISCIANDNTIRIWMSKIIIEGIPLIRVNIGSKLLTNEEVKKIKTRMNNVICENIEQIKWNGLDWDYEKEIWRLPTSRNIYEKIK